MKRLLSLAIVLAPLLAAAVIACDGDGEDRPTASVSVSGAGEVGPGVVQPKPANAAQVDVILQEWSVQPQVTSVRAGEVYFLAENRGPMDPHELVIIRTDLAPVSLPFVNNAVPEDGVNMIGEIEPFTPNSKASAVFTLQAGKYVLICNISEIEAGEIESHYALGMYAAFTVQ
jgi:hypothetical protein